MTKVISKEELAKHKSDKDYWIAIHGKVYDVSKYLDDHPGGADVLTEAAGKDGSTEFDDVGHSNEAIDTMKTFYVGDLEGAGKKATETKQETPKDTQVQNQAGGGRAQRLLIPLVILLLALFIRYALINFVL